MFAPALLEAARRLLDDARAKSLRIVTAESCTGGLIAGLLTEIPGSSDVVERGFVTYSNQAKEDLVGVPTDLIDRHGAVSAEVCRAMAEGALKNSLAQLAVAVTGIAGPSGGTAEKPVGLVYLAVIKQGEEAHIKELRLGNLGRGAIRLETVAEALKLLTNLI